MDERRAPTFEVREGKKSGPYIEDDNVVVINSLTIGDELYVGDYPYGCEGSGHYLGTSLPPGKYKIIRVNDD